MTTAIMSTKGQIVIPKALRDAKGFAPGVGVELVDHPEGLLLRRARTKQSGKVPVETLFGLLKDHWDGGPISIEDMDQAVAEGVAERYRRSLHDHD